MGVAPVDGYGPITKNNAADIYKDKTTFNKLDPSQQAAVKHYLSQDEIEYIDSNTKGAGSNAYQDGKNKLGDDVKNAEDAGSQGGSAVAAGGGAVGCAAGAVALLKAPIYSNVIGAMFGAIGMAVLSALCLVCVSKYDNAYENRTKANDNASTTNGTIDETKSNLEATLESMNEDMDIYAEQQSEMTDMVNANVSEKADLQVQLLDAMAAGDTEGAKELQDQITALDEADYSQQEDELNETREHMQEYQQCNDNALGVADGGNTISGFLNEGTALGIGGVVVSTLLSVATIICGLDAAKAAASFKTIWEVPAAVIACAMLLVSAALLGTATTNMITKTKKEFECGTSGKDMKDSHVNPLYLTVQQHAGYMQFTKEGFDETDTKEGEVRDKAEDSAADTVADAKKRVNSGGGGGEEEEKPKEEEK